MNPTVSHAITFSSVALCARVYEIRCSHSSRPPPGGELHSQLWREQLSTRATTPLEAAYRVADLLTGHDGVGPEAQHLIDEFCDVIDALLEPDCDVTVAAAQVDGLALRADRVGFGVERLEAAARDLRAMAQVDARPLAA